MPRTTVDKEVRGAIRDARRMIQEAEKVDCNEAETRRRIERIFGSLMGYDVLKHLSRERAVRGAGETEHADFAIQLEEGADAQPVIMVEIKRVGVDLSGKHLRQAASYAINAGTEWVILTNGKDWRLYHVAFTQPPVTKMVRSWNILTDDLPAVAKGFELVSYKSLKRGTLGDLWEKTQVLSPRNVLQAMLSETSLRTLRSELKRETGVLVGFEDVVGAIRRLLNEAALAELENVRICLPQRTPRKKRTNAKEQPRQVPTDDFTSARNAEAEGPTSLGG